MLYQTLKSDRVASAYLFYGPKGIGKFAAAVEFVRWLKCDTPESCDGGCHSCRFVKSFDHPDFAVVIPLPSEVSANVDKAAEVFGCVSADPFVELSFEKPASVGIDEIRSLTEKLALAPTSKGGRWAIVRDADLMTPEAANAFLKTLEEPPADAHLILTSSRPDFLFPTIRSRTQLMRFTRLSRNQVAELLVSRGIDPKEAERLALAADGSVSSAFAAMDESSGAIRVLGEELWVCLFSKSDSVALDLVEKLGRDRSLAEAVIASAISFLRDHILMQMGMQDIIANVERSERLEAAAKRFPNTLPLSNVMRFLQEKANSLRLNPQYELFWMDLIIRSRRMIADRNE